MSRFTRPGYVYFLQMEDSPRERLSIVGRGLNGARIRVTREVGVEPIKIGFTAHLSLRVRQHAGNSDGVLKFLGAMACAFGFEGEIHDRYKSVRLPRHECGGDTEMFYPVPELALLVATLPPFDAEPLGLESYVGVPGDVRHERFARRAERERRWAAAE